MLCENTVLEKCRLNLVIRDAYNYMNHVVFWSKFLGHIRVQVLSFFVAVLFFRIFVFRSDFCDGVKMAAQV